MKKIVIISNIPITADNHRAVLEGIFPDISIDVVTISEIRGGLIASDVAVVTALDIVPYAQKYLDPKSRIVQSSYTLKKSQLEMIRSLEDAGPIVVAHETPMAAMARCTLLQRLGIPAEQMRVWYPGMDQNLLKGNIVLFGDMVLPSGYTEAIRIRGRMFSIMTIFEIALGLGIHNITSTPSFEAYFQQVCTEFRPSINDLTVSEFNAIMGNVMWNPDGTPTKPLADAMARGVLLDVGHGAASLDQDVARRAIGAGIREFSISTDAHIRNVDTVVQSLPHTMSKFLSLGMSLEEIVASVTVIPARQLGLDPDWTDLTKRATLFRLRPVTSEDPPFLDAYQNTIPVQQVVEPVAVVTTGTLFPLKPDWARVQ